MAKSCNQKSKILYLEKMLNESAGGKPITMQEILSTLEEHGIRAERKSIYDDMETLKDFGMAIQYRRGREGGYYLVQERVPEMPEMSEMSEVQGMSGEQGDVSLVSGRVAGTPAETVCAVQETLKEEPIHPVVSLDAEAPEQEKNGKEIKLLCKNSVRKEVLKALGKKVPYKSKGEDCFTVVIQTEPDRKFYGWLASMGRSVHILKPKKVAASYREYLKSIAKDYKIDK